ncbi:MAG TPA: YceI family protein [Geminicoccus sp.]|uniref:YceI family protein n=1 Tax=Geminicoccus sp. TaxID=2024832 RepID=UPI002C806C09|nr:YceI family protein [Geminicoccus sp.]HWL72182.1 YceI family protein [Geminicoccus sp.]
MNLWTWLVRAARLPAVALVCLAAALPGPAVAEDWVVDPAASTLTLTIQQGQSPVEARFERFTAEVSFDPAALDQSSVTVTVDLGSFASGDSQRDGQAKGPDFLDAGSAAEAVYRAISFAPLGGDRYQIEAELTLKGVTRALSHEATITVDGDQAHAAGTVPITRTDFGVGTGQFATGTMVGLEVLVAFDLRARSG